jgi:hypothetical protein
MKEESERWNEENVKRKERTHRWSEEKSKGKKGIDGVKKS